MDINFENAFKQLTYSDSENKKLYFSTAHKFIPPFKNDNWYGEFEGIHFCYTFDECKSIAPQLYPKRKFIYSIDYPNDINRKLYMSGDLCFFTACNLSGYFLESTDGINRNILKYFKSPCKIKFTREELNIFQKFFDNNAKDYDSFHTVMKILKRHGYGAIDYAIIEDGADIALLTDTTLNFNYSSVQFLEELKGI